MFCGHGKCSAFFHARPSLLTAEDAASVRGMHRIHSGDTSRLLTSKRCATCHTRYISSYSCTLSSKCSTERQIFCFFSRPALVIDCVRCRFRARNALHSFRRLLSCSPANGAAPRCPRYISSYSCTLSSKCSTERQMFRFFPARPSSLTA